MSRPLVCSTCSHDLFVAYRVIRQKALISAEGALTLVDAGDERGAIDEIYCDRCQTYLWDGSVLGHIEAEPEGGYRLPEEFLPNVA